MPHSRPCSVPACIRRAMTLVELMVSLALVTIIMAACGSMLMVMGKAAANDKSNVGTDATVARSAADQVVDDLKVATAVTEQTANAITMTVPDRDGDGAAETIRYAWSGVAGDPLTRAYNGRAAAVLAANVRALNFSYLGKTVGKPPAVEGAEQSHYTHVGTDASKIKTQKLDGSNWSAQTFKMTFPTSDTSSTTAWKVTRCQVQLQRDLVSTGTVTVSLYYADSNAKPTGAALQSGTVLLLNVLSSGLAWTDVSFGSPASLDPAKSVCLVVSYAAVLGAGGYVGYDDASADPTTTWLKTTDAGTSWTAQGAGKAQQFKAWGTVTTQDNDTYDFQPLPPAAP
jgi:prepilin-type N-terminal cleavage/methylation domain-containing protein